VRACPEVNFFGTQQRKSSTSGVSGGVVNELLENKIGFYISPS